MSREEASRLISSLPIIVQDSPVFDRPDLHSDEYRRAWNAAADTLHGDWKVDALIACGRFGEALESAQVTSGRSSIQASTVLSLKLELNLPADTPEIIGLFGPKLTKFGKDNLESIAQYLRVQLIAGQYGSSLIGSWVDDAHENENGLGLFGGHPSYLSVKPPRGLHFSHSLTAEIYCTKVLRDAENAWREEQNIPKVGEGWIAETKLFYEIKDAFPSLNVLQHARPEWLKRQHLDIFLPNIQVALEYQGEQHDRPIAFFGGEKAFAETKKRDALKAQRCKRNGIGLIYVREGYELAVVIQQVITLSRPTPP